MPITYTAADVLRNGMFQKLQLNKLMLEAKAGDNVYCESISRLGRNVDDLRQLCRHFKENGVTVHFVKEGFNTNGDMYKFLLTILGAVAEMEREITVERVKEGVEKARRYGTKSGRPFGRPPAELPKDFGKYRKRWEAGEITAVEFAKLLGVGRATLYRYLKRKAKQKRVYQPEFIIDSDSQHLNGCFLL